jgi:hypothetical protein
VGGARAAGSPIRPHNLPAAYANRTAYATQPYPTWLSTSTSTSLIARPSCLPATHVAHLLHTSTAAAVVYQWQDLAYPWHAGGEEQWLCSRLWGWPRPHTADGVCNPVWLHVCHIMCILCGQQLPW